MIQMALSFPLKMLTFDFWGPISNRALINLMASAETHPLFRMLVAARWLVYMMIRNL